MASLCLDRRGTQAAPLGSPLKRKPVTGGCPKKQPCFAWSTPYARPGILGVGNPGARGACGDQHARAAAVATDSVCPRGQFPESRSFPPPHPVSVEPLNLTLTGFFPSTYFIHASENFRGRPLASCSDSHRHPESPQRPCCFRPRSCPWRPHAVGLASVPTCPVFSSPVPASRHAAASPAPSHLHPTSPKPFLFNFMLAEFIIILPKEGKKGKSDLRGNFGDFPVSAAPSFRSEVWVHCGKGPQATPGTDT